MSDCVLYYFYIMQLSKYWQLFSLLYINQQINQLINSRMQKELFKLS